MLTTDTPDLVVVGLIVVVHVAIVEVHVPRVVRIVGVGSGRPVAVGLRGPKYGVDARAS